METIQRELKILLRTAAQNTVLLYVSIFTAAIVIVYITTLVAQLMTLVMYELMTYLLIYDPFYIRWWLVLISIIGLVGISIVGVYHLIRLFVVKMVISFFGGTSRNPQSSQVIELAKIHYYLADPSFAEEFDAFLDSRIIESYAPPSTQNLTKTTPRSYIEREVIFYAKGIESGYQGKGDISVRVDIRRGSIEMIITIFGIVYSGISQWEDFNVSISRMRDQVENLVNGVSTIYNGQTNRDIKVRSDVSIEPIQVVTKEEPQEVSSTSTTIGEPSIKSDVSPSITNNVYSYPKQHGNLSLISLLWKTSFLFLLFIVVSYLTIKNDYIHCQILNDSNLCYGWSMEWAFQLTKFFARLSYLFDQLSQSIMP